MKFAVRRDHVLVILLGIHFPTTRTSAVPDRARGTRYRASQAQARGLRGHVLQASGSSNQALREHGLHVLRVVLMLSIPFGWE